MAVSTEPEETEEPEETSNDKGVVCPYCGHLHKDAWEWTRDDECGETECDSCEREFKWSVYTSITYYGKPIAKEGE